MLDAIKRFLSGGLSFTVGIGTSFLCFWLGHKFYRMVPEYLVQYGCKNCAGKGRVPFRPPGGGAMSARTCDRCGGKGIDPDTPLPEGWDQRRSKRRQQERETGQDLPSRVRQKVILAACTRCGARNPNFTDPGVHPAGGGILSWLLRLLVFWRWFR